jgi:hypothetical protein
MAQNTVTKSLASHQDLVAAYIVGALSAIDIRYVASVSHPAVSHLILALFAVAGFLAAYLLIAQSQVDPATKGGTVIGVAVVAGMCFAIVSYLIR